MKHPFSMLVLAFLFLGAGSAIGQTRIGTIDLKKIVDNYWKKDEAYATLKETGADMEKELKTMGDDLKKIESSYQKLVEDAADPAISAEEKEKRKKQADEKRQDFLKKREEATSYQNNAELQLREKKTNVDNRLLSEIRNVIAARAKSGGFTLVLNVGAEAAVMYASSDNDMTDQVINDLNATRPTRNSTADTGPDDKKKKK